jgi:hypothetical protein
MTKAKTTVGTLAAAGSVASLTPQASLTMPAWIGTLATFLGTPAGIAVIGVVGGVSVIGLGVLVWKLSSTSSSTISINPQPITPIPQSNSGGVNAQVVINNNISFSFDGKAFSLIVVIFCASIIYLWKIQGSIPIMQ